MAYSSEEIAVIAVVFTIIAILSVFFGFFWAVLLVFTLLWLLYKFGRQNMRKKVIKTTQQVDSKKDEGLDGNLYNERGIDVPFTGINSPKIQSIRSPLPLLSVVTKRLSFNTSSFSPRNDGRTIYRRSFGSPAQPSMQQSPRYFSLISTNFHRQQPQSTVKIAPPPIKHHVAIQEEANEPASDPLSRSTILSALKHSTTRKRSAYEKDEDDDIADASTTTNINKKRRYNYPSPHGIKRAERSVDTSNLEVTQDILVKPVKSVNQLGSEDVNVDLQIPGNLSVPGIGGLIQARLKRRPLHSSGDDNEVVKDALSKKKRSESSNLPQSKTASSLQDKPLEISQTTSICSLATCESTVQTSDSSSKTSRIKAVFHHYDDSDSGCDADDDDDIIMKNVPLNTARTITRSIDGDGGPIKSMGTPSTYEKTQEKHTSTGEGGRVSKKQMISHTIEIASSPAKQSNMTDSLASPGWKNIPKKKFSITRFPSKNSESKRRPVPVYCSSVDSPDLRKRTTSHKITKQDIETDRKLAWKKIQSFLDMSDDEEEDPAVTSSSIAINVITCLASSPPKSKVSISTQGSSASSSTLQIKPIQLPVASSLNNTASNAASLTTNSATIGIATVSPRDLSKTRNLISSGITFGTPTKSQPKDSPANPTALSSATLSSQSLQTPALQVQVSQKPPNAGQSSLTAPVSTSLQADVKPSSGLSSNTPLGGTSLQGSSLLSSALTATNSSQRGSIGVSSKISNLVTGGLSTSVLQQSSSNMINPLATGPTRSGVLGGTASTVGSSIQTGLNSSKPTTSLLSSVSHSTSNASLNFGTTTSSGSAAFSFGAKTTGNATTQQTAALDFGSVPISTNNFFTGSSTVSASSTLSTPQKHVMNSFGSSINNSQGGVGGSSFGQPSNTSKTTVENKPGFSFVIPPAPQAAPTCTAPAVFAAKNNASSSTQNQFVSSTSQIPFGAAPSQNAFGISGNQNAFAASSTQSNFGSNLSQNTFSSLGQSSSAAGASQNTFGTSTKQVSFGGSSINNAFGTGSSQNTFGPPAATPQNLFGSASSSNVSGFGQPAKPSFGSTTFDKPGFGTTSSTQSLFGSMSGSTRFFTPNKSSTPSSSGGFNFSTGTTGGLSTTGGFNFGDTKSSSKPDGFSFSGGGATSSSAPGSGGFNFNSGSSASSGGFNFTSNTGNATSSNTPGGFNFRSASTAKPAGGFAFGSPAPSGGFKFGATQQNTPTQAPVFGSPSVQNTSIFGGTSASPAFGASTGTPGGFAFGASSQTSSSSVAKVRTKATARRRNKK